MLKLYGFELVKLSSSKVTIQICQWLLLPRPCEAQILNPFIITMNSMLNSVWLGRVQTWKKGFMDALISL